MTVVPMTKRTFQSRDPRLNFENDPNETLVQTDNVSRMVVKKSVTVKFAILKTRGHCIVACMWHYQMYCALHF